MNTGKKSILLANWRMRHNLPWIILACFASLFLLGIWLKPASAHPLQESLAAPALEPAAPDAGYDLKIVKSQYPPTFTVGSTNTYIFNVTRANTNTIASSIQIDDYLPSGITWTPVNSGKWNCVGGSDNSRVNCLYNESSFSSDLALQQLTVAVVVAPDVSPVVTNTAKLLVTGDSNPVDNTSSVKTVIDSADVGIKKTYVWNGTDIDYTITITNAGPATARNVVMNDPLSTDLTYQIISANMGVPVLSATNLQWTIASLPKGSIATLVYRATPLISADGKQVTNTATVTIGNRSDWKTNNNSSSVTVTIGGLRITKSVYAPNLGQIYVGESVDFYIHLVNASPANALNVTVNDIMIPELNIDSIGFTVGSGTAGYIHSSRTAYAYMASLAPYSNATVWIRAHLNSKVDFVETLANYATVTWNKLDSATLSAESNEVTFVAWPLADVHVGKTNGVTNINAGQTVTYRVSVTNSGSLPAYGVIFTDTLGGYMTLVNAYNLGPISTQVITDATTGRTVAKLLGSLQAGVTTSIQVVAKVAANAPPGGQIMNTAIASSVNPDENPDNNIAYDIDDINVPPSVRFEMRVSDTQLRVNEPVSFRVDVKNTGSNSMTSVVVTDVFPSVLDITEATTTIGTVTVNSSSRTTTATIGTLAPGENVVIAIRAKVNSSATLGSKYSHTSTLTCCGNIKLTTNTVKFRIVEATLPSTGLGGPQPRDLSRFVPLALGSAFFMGILGLVALVYGLWARGHRPMWAAFYAGIGVILTLGCAVFGMGAAGLASTAAPVSATGIAWIPSEQSPEGSTPESLPTFAASPTPLPTVSPTFEPAKPNILPTIAPPTEIPTTLAQPTTGPQATQISQIFPTATSTPAALPEFSIPTPSIRPTLGPNGIPADESSITRIVIPSMRLDTVVKFVPFSGETWPIAGLKQEVAWMGGTSWPGLGSNTGLAGHVDLVDGSPGPFWNLGTLRSGDQVILYTEKNIFTYQAREQKIVEDTDISVIDATEHAQITLITCTTWDSDLYTYLKRLVVFADLVNVQPLQ